MEGGGGRLGQKSHRGFAVMVQYPIMQKGGKGDFYYGGTLYYSDLPQRKKKKGKANVHHGLVARGKTFTYSVRGERRKIDGAHWEKGKTSVSPFLIGS